MPSAKDWSNSWRRVRDLNPHVPCGTAVFKTAAIPLGEPSESFGPANDTLLSQPLAVINALEEQLPASRFPPSLKLLTMVKYRRSARSKYSTTRVPHQPPALQGRTSMRSRASFTRSSISFFPSARSRNFLYACFAPRYSFSRSIETARKNCASRFPGS